MKYYVLQNGLEQIVIHLEAFLKEKNPDLIIVSLGFDAHKLDPLEGMNISDLTYIYMTLRLKQLNIPVMFLLEGGYNIKTIGRIIPQMVNILK